MANLTKDISKLEVPQNGGHFDIEVACEDDKGEDLDVLLLCISFS